MRIHEFITELSQRERKDAAGGNVKLLDQFFTRPEIAKAFYDWSMGWLKNQPVYRHKKRIRKIEPAAGNKDIAKYFQGIEMYDLDPQHPDIKQQDFLTSQHKPSNRPEHTMVIMNPPFGKNNDLAIKFFNKAAEFSDIIAQIVPISFRRETLHNQLNDNWHLVAEKVLPRNSFYIKKFGPQRGFNVNAVMQIWVKRQERREPLQIIPKPAGITFLKAAQADQANVAFRHSGHRAGQIVTDNITGIDSPSFWFMNVTPDILQRMKGVPWREYGNNNVGARHITKRDFYRALS